MEIHNESQLIFVRACVQAGADGLSMCTQGRLREAPGLIAKKEISAACPFNILRVCQFVAPHASYDAVRDYPGHVVNCGTKLTGGQISSREISRLSKRPRMVGMDRRGILATGTPQHVEDEIKRVLKSARRQSISGVDRTVSGDTDGNRLGHAPLRRPSSWTLAVEVRTICAGKLAHWRGVRGANGNRDWARRAGDPYPWMWRTPIIPRSSWSRMWQ